MAEFAPPDLATMSLDTTPDLPPSLAELHNKTAPEILASLNSTPLFMTELEDNDGLEAFKALAYEGTPIESSTNFKEHGNECFKCKQWPDAKEFYTKGITILLAEVRKRQRGEKSESEPVGQEREGEIKEELSILETLLVNRAATHLSLKNYRSCTLDCANALRLNPSNIKALYRSSRALLSLSRITEADDACARGLELDADNAPLLGIAQEIIKKNAEIQARRQREAERELNERKKLVLLKTALKARNIKTRSTPQPPEMEDAAIAMTPDPLDPQSMLTFPTILLYPLQLQSDFIKAFNELNTVAEHLEDIFPAEWDKEGEYTVKGTEAYMETVKGGLIKVGRKVSLMKVLSEGDVEVVDQVVRIYVVPKKKAAGWIEEWKRKKVLENNIE